MLGDLLARDRSSWRARDRGFGDHEIMSSDAHRFRWPRSRVFLFRSSFMRVNESSV
jgi:hypothetical protein